MEDRQEHLSVIRNILEAFNSQRDNPYVLKGGTALSLCYSLNRFSEVIDLDAASTTISQERFKHDILRICAANRYNCRIGKYTPTAKKAYIDYGHPDKPLKVELSLRRKVIPDNLVCTKNGIQVYTLDEMARLKAAAYNGRDKIRDLYDVTYIITHFYDSLGESARDALRTALEYKDLEQYDYIVRTQKDELIDPEVIETMFLESFDKLGLLSPAGETPTPVPEHVTLRNEAMSSRRASKELNEADEIELPKTKGER